MAYLVRYSIKGPQLLLCGQLRNDLHLRYNRMCQTLCYGVVDTLYDFHNVN